MAIKVMLVMALLQLPHVLAVDQQQQQQLQLVVQQQHEQHEQQMQQPMARVSPAAWMGFTATAATAVVIVRSPTRTLFMSNDPPGVRVLRPHCQSWALRQRQRAGPVRAGPVMLRGAEHRCRVGRV